MRRFFSFVRLFLYCGSLFGLLGLSHAYAAPRTYQTELQQSQIYPYQTTTLHIKQITPNDAENIQSFAIPTPTSDQLTITPQAPKQSNTDNAVVVEQDFLISGEQAGVATLTLPATKPQQWKLTIKAIPANYKGTWLPASNVQATQQWQDSQGQSITKQQHFIAGEPIIRHINLTVEGTIQQRIPAIRYQLPEAVKVYRDPASFKVGPNGKLHIEIQQTFLIRHSGEYQLPAIEMPWWNITQDKEKVTQLDSLKVQIKGDLSDPTAVSSHPKTFGWVALLLALVFISIVSFVCWRWWKHRHPKKDETTQVNEPQFSWPQLHQAIAQQDGSLMQNQIHLWLLQHATLPQEARSAVQLQQQKIMAALYSSQQKDIATLSVQLIAMMHRLEKHYPTNKTALNTPLIKM